MGKHVIETLMGAVVLIVAIGFIAFAYQSSGIAAATGYPLTAKFDRIDGLSVGSDVRISGIKVGTVAEQHLNPKTYLAEVVMTIDNQVQLPVDTSAEIVSDGLLGSKYLSLVPGGEDKLLKSGDAIKYTQSSFSLENLIGKFMFSGGGDKSSSSDKSDQKQDSEF